MTNSQIVFRASNLHIIVNKICSRVPDVYKMHFMTRIDSNLQVFWIWFVLIITQIFEEKTHKQTASDNTFSLICTFEKKKQEINSKNWIIKIFKKKRLNTITIYKFHQSYYNVFQIYIIWFPTKYLQRTSNSTISQSVVDLSVYGTT